METILAISVLGFFNQIPAKDFVTAGANADHRSAPGLIGSSRYISILQIAMRRIRDATFAPIAGSESELTTVPKSFAACELLVTSRDAFVPS